MDDFGSAYSSLNVLKEFSFDELKLDMSFLRPFNHRSKRIVTAIVRMAKVIDVHTLSEGASVEMPCFRERKCILIADDIESNREMLGDLLCEDYDILYASDGVEALDMLSGHRNEISLLILDLYMPNMPGQEVIARMQADEGLKSIPIIVLTVDHKAEAECLKLGALDFIPKPYPSIEIVKARIEKCIAISEKQ